MDAPRDEDNEALAAGLPDSLRAPLARYRAEPSDARLHELVAAALSDFSIDAPPSSLSDETNFVEDLGLDSLAVTEFVFFFEDAFDLRISNEQLAEMRTIGALKSFLKSRLA